MRPLPAFRRATRGTVFTAGDNAYPDGAAAELACYDRSWGGFKHRTYPSPGNHEYQSDGAAPYFAYFGARAGPAGRGYYSYDLGGWHVVALNSERDLDAEAGWLAADLAAHPAACTLAYWHKPLVTSGSEQCSALSASSPPPSRYRSPTAAARSRSCRRAPRTPRARTP